MNEKEKWLKERLNTIPVLEEGEKQCIDCLNDKQILEADLSSCIDVLEILLSLDALLPLVNFMKDGQHSLSLRKQAAKAISVIGSDYIQTELTVLLASPSSELRMLAEIALIKKLG
jgi:hypothetical protein